MSRYWCMYEVSSHSEDVFAVSTLDNLPNHTLERKQSSSSWTPNSILDQLMSAHDRSDLYGYAILASRRFISFRLLAWLTGCVNIPEDCEAMIRIIRVHAHVEKEKDACIFWYSSSGDRRTSHKPSAEWSIECTYIWTQARGPWNACSLKWE